MRNGPGLFEIGGIPVSQPFDGDGMVSCPARVSCLPDMHVTPHALLKAHPRNLSSDVAYTVLRVMSCWKAREHSAQPCLIGVLSLQVNSWAIKDGRCYYRNRYVRTDALMAEQEAGRMLFKGAFSRGDPAGCPIPLP